VATTHTMAESFWKITRGSRVLRGGFDAAGSPQVF